MEVWSWRSQSKGASAQGRGGRGRAAFSPREAPCPLQTQDRLWNTPAVEGAELGLKIKTQYKQSLTLHLVPSHPHAYQPEKKQNHKQKPNLLYILKLKIQ